MDGGGAFLTKTDQETRGTNQAGHGGHLRGIIGQLTVEEIVKQPELCPLDFEIALRLGLFRQGKRLG